MGRGEMLSRGVQVRCCDQCQYLGRFEVQGQFGLKSLPAAAARFPQLQRASRSRSALPPWIGRFAFGGLSCGLQYGKHMVRTCLCGGRQASWRKSKPGSPWPSPARRMTSEPCLRRAPLAASRPWLQSAIKGSCFEICPTKNKECDGPRRQWLSGRLGADTLTAMDIDCRAPAFELDSAAERQVYNDLFARNRDK